MHRQAYDCTCLPRTPIDQRVCTVSRHSTTLRGCTACTATAQVAALFGYKLEMQPPPSGPTVAGGDPTVPEKLVGRLRPVADSAPGVQQQALGQQAADMPTLKVP
jgi:hypothetical protein